jgi:hypothetical protein
MQITKTKKNGNRGSWTLTVQYDCDLFSCLAGEVFSLMHISLCWLQIFLSLLGSIL